MPAPPCAVPHPQAIFSLLPLNENAHAVIQNPSNYHLLSSHVDSMHRQHHMLNVGFQIGSAARYTLATLGRNGDIVVDGPSISRIQCSFEILPEYDVVMLYDESTSQTTQVFGDEATPFRPGCKRKVVVGERFNKIIGMGGIGCDQVQFEMGSFGVVHKAVNAMSTREELWQPKPFRNLKVDSNPSKKIDWSERLWHSIGVLMLRNIVEYIHWYSSSHELWIFTALKAGGVDNLIDQKYFDQNPGGVNELLGQMLQALDYLAYNRVIHRDVKPANILYTPLESAQSHFLYQLTDFGLCNSTDAARSNVGSPMYQAPEVQSPGRDMQTCKVDVWSLFVTVAVALNVNQYGSKMLSSHAECVAFALQAASAPELQTIKDMTEIDPSKRPSAAQMLVKCYNGRGLTTPRNEVPNYPKESLPMPFHTGFPNPQPGWPPSGLAYPSPPAVPNEHWMGAHTYDGPQFPQRQTGAPNRTTSALGARRRPHPPTDSKREPTQHGFPSMFAWRQ
ncbi:hypothetical protein RJ035_002643 [Blastomyces gilchristii]